MRALTPIITIMLLGVFALGCDTNDADEPFADMAGTFEAESFEFARIDSPDVARDFVADGDEVRLEIEPDGRFRQTFSADSRFENRSGTVTRDGTTLSFTDAGSSTPREFDFTFNGGSGQLTLSQQNRMFAFEEGGTQIPTRFSSRWRRAR